MWRWSQRQADEHARIREAVEYAARSRTRRVCRSGRHVGATQARRHGRDRSLQFWSRVSTLRPEVRLGLGANLGQFSLLVVVNAFVGAMVGLERSILPAIAEQEFHLAAHAAVLSFIV